MWIETRFFKANDPKKMIETINGYLDSKNRNDTLILQSLLSGDLMAGLRIHSGIKNLDENAKIFSDDWGSGLLEKSSGAELVNVSLSSAVANNDPNGELDGQLNYYHFVSCRSKFGGSEKAAIMANEWHKTVGPDLLKDGVRSFVLNPVTGNPLNRLIWVRGFKNGEVADKALSSNDPNMPTHSLFSRIFEEQFVDDVVGGLFRTIRQLIH